MIGDYKLVKQALLGENKYDLEHRDSEGKTLLMWAVHHGKFIRILSISFYVMLHVAHFLPTLL